MSEELIEKARGARKKAYDEYSNFSVGAAIRCGSGEVYTGCNIEISGRNTSVHGESLALFNAVMAGEEEFETIAVSCSDGDGHVPCGLCLHTLSEFMEDIEILTDEGDSIGRYSLEEQYVDAYRPGDHD